ncbi:hypothetical protein I6N96_12765 [Enterococcus sp. BWM-S5]|uniref:Conjugal transfer protein n=1 Tax=Enterococcus larvae TaxID=2794352 RepID=A0ABS4CKK4_9ENTE|nr:hypothetical protein [Enterococcus larvae]MBP1047146.1 hypothetical protein [Enterococcus larvae]
METKTKVIIGTIGVVLLAVASFYLQKEKTTSGNQVTEISSSQKLLSPYTPQSSEETTTSASDVIQTNPDLHLFNVAFVQAFNEYDSLVERSRRLEPYMTDDLYKYYRIEESPELTEANSTVEINAIYENVQQNSDFLNDITVTIDNVKKRMIFRVKYISEKDRHSVSEVEFLSVQDAILD